MDKSVFEVILRTCSKIEIPPKPRRKAVKIILIDIFLHAILEILLIPFVISNIPVNKGWVKSVSICINSKIGLIKLEHAIKIPLDFKIDIILENITTKPPINKTVEILLEILSAKTSPRLEKDTAFICFLLDEYKEDGGEFFLFFQKRKITPTDMQANM